MKVNLLLAGANSPPRADYLNIDPLAPPADDRRVIGDVFNLDAHVDDAEADELVALDIIDFAPARELDNVIDNWTRKIRHGGTLTIGGIDVRQVAIALANKTVSIREANILLYGGQSAPYDYRKATLSMDLLEEILKGRGFKIIANRFDRPFPFYYFIKAERP